MPLVQFRRRASRTIKNGGFCCEAFEQHGEIGPRFEHRAPKSGPFDVLREMKDPQVVADQLRDSPWG